MKHLKSISIFFIMLAFLVACSEDLPTEATNTEATNASGQPMPDVAGVTDLNGILSTIYYDFDSGIEGIPAVGLSMVILVVQPSLQLQPLQTKVLLQRLTELILLGHVQDNLMKKH